MINIKTENIGALRIDLYALDIIHKISGHPANILKKYEAPHINYAWIPQTIGDQIWVLYEFETKQERLKWQEGLPDFLKEMLDRKLIDYFLEDDYGWNIRDINGLIKR